MDRGKILNKKGGVPIIVVIFLSIVVIAVLIPTLYNAQKIANTSKTIKSHINAVSSSACTNMIEFDRTGKFNTNLWTALDTTKICFTEIFEEPITIKNTNLETGILSRIYQNNDGTIKIQCIAYMKSQSNLEPSSSRIDDFIKLEDGEEIDMSQIENSIKINKPSVIIIVKQKINLMGTDKTIVRIGSSQVNVTN